MISSSVMGLLKLFHALEALQVRFYEKAKDVSDDLHWQNAIRTFTAIEKEHVINISAAIERLGGGEPSEPIAVASRLIGALMGEITRIRGMEQVMYLGQKVEQEAIIMYYALIAKTEEFPELQQMLWSNLVEEELHALWFYNRRMNGPPDLRKYKPGPPSGGEELEKG